MSRSRSELFERHKALVLAANDPAVSDNPNDKAKDLAAKLFRNGLAVMCFSTIESFIRDRTNEVLSSVDPARINFSELPDGVQQAAALGALKAINFRANQNQDDWNATQQFVIDQTRKIASLGQTSFTLSEYSFGHDKSNLSSGDVCSILQAFKIDGPWEKIKIVASQVGYGGAVSYEQEFRNIAQRRHSAAHSMTSQVTQTDLLNAASSIFAIAFGFDLIITACLALLRKRDTSYLQNSGAAKFRFNPNGIKIGRLIKDKRGWGFFLPGKARAKERGAEVDPLYLRAQQYAQQHSLAIVQFAQNSLPTRWHIGA